MESILTPLPAGVAIPPTAADIGIPIITLLPKVDSPGKQLLFLNISYAIPPTITPVGISAKKYESNEVVAINPSKTFLLLLPNMLIRCMETLFPKPTFEKALAIRIDEKMKNSVGVAKFFITFPVVSSPNNCGKNSISAEDAPIGIYSVTQVIVAQIINTIALHPLTDKPSGGVILLITA